MADTENPGTPEEIETPPQREQVINWHDGDDETDPDEPGYLDGTAMMRQ